MTNELLTILTEVESHCFTKTPIALATVVFVRGSAYRRPGAQMLVREDGTRFGSVSGGCLEADVAFRAKGVMETGIPEYVLYDSKSSNGDLVFELGCGGAVGILIEKADTPALLTHLRSREEIQKKRAWGVIATVYGGEGEIEVGLGTRWLFNEDGELSEGKVAPLPDNLLLVDAQETLRDRQRRNRTCSFPNGSLEVLFEPILPPISLILCGAGQDAIPLAQFASQLGWNVTVFDPRENYLTRERFPNAHTLIAANPERILDHLTLDSRTAVVLMTHSYSQDAALLQRLLPARLPYLGLLGPKRRAERLLAEMQEDGFCFDAPLLESLHSPAGLDIGSETPEEIALAILAEIKAALSSRPGTPLRLRREAIHEDSQSRKPQPLPESSLARARCRTSA